MVTAETLPSLLATGLQFPPVYNFTTLTINYRVPVVVYCVSQYTSSGRLRLATAYSGSAGCSGYIVLSTGYSGLGNAGSLYIGSGTANCGVGGQIYMTAGSGNR